MIDLLLYVMLLPWVALVSLTAVYLIHDLIKSRRDEG